MNQQRDKINNNNNNENDKANVGFNEQKHVSRDEWVISRLESVIQFHWKVDLCISVCILVHMFIYRVMLCAKHQLTAIHACTRPKSLTNTTRTPEEEENNLYTISTFRKETTRYKPSGILIVVLWDEKKKKLNKTYEFNPNTISLRQSNIMLSVNVLAHFFFPFPEKKRTLTHILSLLDIKCKDCACIEWTMEQLLLFLCVSRRRCTCAPLIRIHLYCVEECLFYIHGDPENNSNNNGKDSKSRIDSVFTSCYRVHCCCFSCWFVFFFFSYSSLYFEFYESRLWFAYLSSTIWYRFVCTKKKLQVNVNLMFGRTIEPSNISFLALF